MFGIPTLTDRELEASLNMRVRKRMRELEIQETTQPKAEVTEAEQKEIDLMFQKIAQQRGRDRRIGTWVAGASLSISVISGLLLLTDLTLPLQWIDALKTAYTGAVFIAILSTWQLLRDPPERNGAE